MAEMVELVLGEDGWELADDAGDIRVSQTSWNRYTKAHAALAGIKAEIAKTAVRPVYCTPEQEEALRSVAKPGAWIVVREQTPEVAVQQRDVAAAGSSAPEPLESAPAPSGPPQRPVIGACPRRGGLPHQPARFAYTDAVSVYFPGLKRVDGICQCGMTIADVQCPHMKQQDEDGRGPRCRNCGKFLVSHAGVIDNRNLGGRAIGAPDPNVDVPVQPGATEAPADAYRAPA